MSTAENTAAETEVPANDTVEDTNTETEPVVGEGEEEGAETAAPEPAVSPEKAELEALRAELNEYKLMMETLMAGAVGEIENTDTLDYSKPENWKKAAQEAAKQAQKEMADRMRQEHINRKAEADARAFVQANPDIMKPENKREVAKLMQQHPTLEIQDAWSMVRAKQLEAERSEYEDARRRLEEAGLKTRPRGRFTPPPEVLQDGRRAERYFQANPISDPWSVYEDE